MRMRRKRSALFADVWHIADRLSIVGTLIFGIIIISIFSLLLPLVLDYIFYRGNSNISHPLMAHLLTALFSIFKFFAQLIGLIAIFAYFFVVVKKRWSEFYS
ncbi:hypothetical protein [Beggiatoa leptomitoformis]|uniref:Uncharacterized protein n=1 Tax=Beggiatoa leptomitoformis TaxID=288004 RepID=A0A2N9YHJ5_9GAMM|nr:hypothetical protein [Beggiatoa leptomitoformis]ALG67775.1 hypothetical protein AL038_08725 [Beggiatoa leptomitoformis]AUI69980.1 hypothetical protein BLE401_15585 [Beggiatoa leptomitoformis]